MFDLLNSFILLFLLITIINRQFNYDENEELGGMYFTFPINYFNILLFVFVIRILINLFS